MNENIDVILSNLAYIRNELPGLRIDDDLRQILLSTCQELEGGVAELRHQLESAAVPRAREMIQRQVRTLHETVTRLRDLPPSGADAVALCVLFNESGANILRAYASILDSLPPPRP
jgi:hypothetical protein